MIKVAIHHREGSFSERWIQYCEEKNVSYIIVNCYDSDIIEVLRTNNITHLMWHFHHSSTIEKAVASNVFFASELMGIKTFPNFENRWHFDDKIAQKYLFESLNIPHVKSWVFYKKAAAQAFLKNTNFPIVAKLRRGAGSMNVQLLNDEVEANNYVEKMFSGEISNSGLFKNIKTKWAIAKRIKNPVKILSKVKKSLEKHQIEKITATPEKGYVYLQEFLPSNEFDIRLVVVGDKIFGLKRFNRKNDFRASGSGLIDYDIINTSECVLNLAFEASQKIKGQVLAFDIIFDKEKNPRIIEVCYAFTMLAYDRCLGYWDNELNFHPGQFNPQYFMIENFINGN